MKKIIELNQEDIKQLIAKNFHVEKEHISISVKQVWNGHGINEYKVNEISATIIIQSEYEQE